MGLFSRTCRGAALSMEGHRWDQVEQRRRVTDDFYRLDSLVLYNAIVSMHVTLLCERTKYGVLLGT